MASSKFEISDIETHIKHVAALHVVVCATF